MDIKMPIRIGGSRLKPSKILKRHKFKDLRILGVIGA
jgi:hypothetical protein